MVYVYSFNFSTQRVGDRVPVNVHNRPAVFERLGKLIVPIVPVVASYEILGRQFAQLKVGLIGLDKYGVNYSLGRGTSFDSSAN